MEAQPVSPIDTSAHNFQASRNDDSNVTQSPVSPIMSQRTSYESDRTSTTVSNLITHFPNHPINADPPPAYVGHAGASQAVGEQQFSSNAASSASEDRHHPADALFSDSALALINAFLDQLLYSFLSSARSTSLPALRPAVADVLKHRLAKEATSNADAELSELLGGAEDEEEMDNTHKAQEAKRKWDLELVWKRTRLRVMVYMRLGEMEDEDEQRYVEREELFQGTERSFSSTGGLVAWSAAIYLTSVLEYVAEQCLQAAGQAAYNRMRRESGNRPSSSSAHDHAEGAVIVEEHDVEKIALNSSLGRLWRTWRKALRNQGVSIRPSSSSISRASRENMASRTSHHTDALTNDSRPMSRDQQDDIPEAEYPEHILAANIPLPMSSHTRDIDEIAAVGLARDPDDDAEEHSEPSDSPYPEHVLAPLVPLPLHSEQRDLDELIVPGLARDPDSKEESEHPLDTPYPAIMLAPLVALPAIDLKRDVDEIEVPGLAKDPDAAEEDFVHVELWRRRSFADLAPTLANESLIPRPRSTSVPAAARAPMFAEQHPALETPVESTKTVADGAEVSTVHGPLAKEKASEEQSSAAEETKDDATSRGQNPESHDHSNTEVPMVAAGTVAAIGTAAVGVAAISSIGSMDDPHLITTTDAAEDVRQASSADQVQSQHVGSDQLPLPDKEPEEVDKRKSLGDIKSLLAADSTSEKAAQEPSSNVGLHVPAIARTPSNESYNLVDSPGNATAADTLVNGIGIAQTTETAVAERKVKEPGKRPAALNLDTPNKEQDDNNPEVTTPRTMRTFLDLTENKVENGAEEPRATMKEEIPQPALKIATEGLSERSSPQETSSSIFGSPRPSQGKFSLDSNGVQEHPVVYKMASLKGSGGHSSSGSGSETALPLTSAAIRGPEDFDLFVQGGETLKYTLTPEGVRDTPADSSIRYSKARQSPIEMDGTPSTPKTRSSGDSRTGTVRNSVLKDAVAPTGEGRPSEGERYKVLGRPSPRSASVGWKTGLTAREPRVVTESTRDFADFIRSTGPNGASTATPALLSTTSPSLLSGNNQVASTASRISPASNRSKTNMQPRGAKVETDGSADLIDFIRSGPHETGQHRIPRTVAPFRTTMDSDQFDDLGARPSGDTLAQSLRSSSLYTPSFRTSTNSRSALLNGTTNSINQTAPLAPQNGNAFSAPAGMLPEASSVNNSTTGRKQYRNKDPYALDFDDDFDDELFTAPRKPAQKEESMFDFLRNHEPTPTGPTQPLIDPNSPQAQRLIQDARARQQISSPTERSAILPKDETTPTGSRVPTPQYAGTYQPTRPKMEARSAVAQGQGAELGGTKDLAEFFRSSGPGATGVEADGAATKKKKSGIFGLPKRKTYLDMP